MNSTETVGAGVARRPRRRFGLPDKGTYIVLALILSLGMFLISPVLVILTLSFNTSPNFFIGAREWGLGNWTTAFQTPGLWTALFNTVWLWVLSATVAFPIAVTIAWFLARTKIPHSHALEFLFWISYVTPGGLVAWIMLFDPNIGLANVGLEALPFISNGPFNIFSIEGIIFVNIIGSGISLKVMLLTPAFRNMDSAMEEAAPRRRSEQRADAVAGDGPYDDLAHRADLRAPAHADVQLVRERANPRLADRVLRLLDDDLRPGPAP